MTEPAKSVHFFDLVLSDGILDGLCASSRRHYSNPYAALDWPDEPDRSQWFISTA